MKRLGIYLDTSVINFLFADDAPEFARCTREFFARHAQCYDLFISEVVLEELERTPDRARRDAMLRVLDEHQIALLDTHARAEVEQLAACYVTHGIVPAAKVADALHVAYAVVYELDILLSWNFKHLANVRKEILFAGVNLEQGYPRPLRLVSPLEVAYEQE